MKVSKTYSEFISEKKSKKTSPASKIKKLTKKQKGLIDKAKDIKDEVSTLAADKDKNPEDKLTTLLLKNKINQTEIDGQKIAIQKQQIALNSKIKGVKKKKKGLPKNEQLSAYADELSLEEGLFGWLSGLFKNPALKRKVRKLKEELIKIKIELGNLKLEGDPIEEFEAELKAKDNTYVSSKSNPSKSNDVNAHELRIKTLEDSEEAVILGLDSLAQESEVLQKYVDKIKLEARMESNNAIIRAADSHIARVIKKIQRKDKKSINQMDDQIETLMKQDESYQSYLSKLSSSTLNEEDSYSDYPVAAKKNAQMAIDWKEKYGREEVDAGTAVGWARAHQLAKGENISKDTIKRMSSFNRHRKNSTIATEYKDTPWKDRGYVAWLIWGGTEGVDWAMKKSKEIDNMKESNTNRHINLLYFDKLEHNTPTSYVTEKGYNMEDIYDLIAFHRFDTDFRKLSSKDKEWVENDAKERGFNESLLESDIVDKYYSLIDELYEAKPGPKPYHRGLDDDEIEDKKDQIKKQSDMDDDDSSAYKEMPGDKEARKKGEVKTSKHVKKYHELYGDKKDESVVTEAKIKYSKGKTYQSDGHWTVYVDSNSSGFDIRVNHSAGWRLDPHDKREETLELLDNGRQRATLNFKSGNIDKFAQQMFDLNDRTTNGNQTKLTASDYADIIRVWIDMKMANESIVTEAKSYQEKFKDEASAYQEMINDPSKRVYDIVDFAQFTTGGMTEKQWEMFMYGRYKKNLQSKDSKTKEKMYKVLTKWLSESSKKMKYIKTLNEASDVSLIKQLTDTFGKFKLPRKYEIMMDSIYGTGSKWPVLRKKKEYREGCVIDTLYIDGGSNYEGYIELKDARSARPIPGKSRFAADEIDDAMEAAVKYVDGIKESVTENRELMKIDSYLNTKDENVLIDFLDDAYGNSDDRKTKKEWNDVRNDLSYNELVDYAVSHAENFGMDLQDIEDAIEVYESIVTESRYPNFKFGKKKQYDADDINQMYGFWGTLDIHMNTEEIEEIWNEVCGILTKSWKFSDAGALYYLNAKAGRWLADKIWNDINSQISQPDAIDMILSDYARPSQWKAWSKEYNEFAQEELAESIINEKAEGDRGPISDPKIEKALKTKSEETGVPIGIIRIIMRRGMAAWKTGHRPGATEQQWGYARVNAFLTKGSGTWGDADKDVAKEVRDEGHDGNLKSS
jgi:hypothetical protein